MGHESPEQVPIEPSQPSFEFGRFRAVCFVEGGITEKELVEEDGKFYDDDGSTYEEDKTRKGVFRLKVAVPPGFKEVYESIKRANPDAGEGLLKFYTDQELRERKGAADRAAGIVPEKKKGKRGKGRRAQ
jgi:hypothetical protein